MSNLLDKASIILTPTAYNNGEALCVKPSDGSGDFDFSRNSAATRVNAQGLVENVQILSSNLVQNGDFSEEGVQEVSNGSFSQEGSEEITNGDFENGSTGWALNGWTISNGKANCNGITANLIQSNVGSANKTFKLVFTISNYISGKVIPSFVGLSNESLEYNANGTYTTYISSLTDLRFVFYGNLFNGSIDNVSVREVGQDWTLGTGWSIGEDKAICDGTTSNLDQFSTSIIGKSYKVALTVNNITTGALSVRLGSTSSSEVINITSNRTYIAYGVAETTYLRLRSQSGFDGSVTNISVKEVGQNWALGSFTSIGNNVANIVNSTGELSLQQDIGVSQKTIKLTYTISNYSSGGIRPQYGAVNGLNRSANGTYAEIITGTNLSSNLSFFSITANTTATITNISVIEITDDTNLPRINYEGFSYQDALGSEEIVNGTFDTDSDWNKASGVTISDGKANAAFGSSGNILRQSLVTFDANKTYKYEFTISNYVSGNLKFASFIGAINESGNGTYVGYGKPNGTGVNNMILFGSFEGSIDNVSVKEYLGQEVVPDSGCGSWLWEPQSTNLITQSELFSDATWTKVGGGAADDTIITSNYATSPDGTNNASRAQFNAVGTANGDRANLYANINVTSGQTFTMSFYGKSATATNEEVVLRMGSVQQVSVTLTQEYQRFSHTYTVTSSGAKNFGIQIRGNSAVTSADIIIWGFQVEQQSYATSYIPTEGTQKTRNQDVCTNGGSLASINSTEGTLYFEGSALVGGSNTQISLSDGTNDNGVKLRFDLNPDRFTIFLRGNSGTFAIKTITGVTQTDNNKIALVWDITNFRIWINGTEQGLIATNDLPIGLDTLNFANNTGSSNFQGKTKALAVFPYLSDSELQSLTTI